MEIIFNKNKINLFINKILTIRKIQKYFSDIQDDYR